MLIFVAQPARRDGSMWADAWFVAEGRCEFRNDFHEFTPSDSEEDD
jgi:hypothetical protein